MNRVTEPEEPQEAPEPDEEPEATEEVIAPLAPSYEAVAVVTGPSIVAGLWGPVAKFDCSACAFSTVDPDPAVHAGHLATHEAPHDQPGGLNG